MSQFGPKNPADHDALEAEGAFPHVFRRWTEALPSRKPGLVELELELALLEGNAERLGALLAGFLLKLSGHDSPTKDAEAYYHDFFMGLLVALADHLFEVRSNRKSGHGRCDLLLVPKRPGLPGVVLKIVVLPMLGSSAPSKQTVDAELDAALLQMETLAYAAELRDRKVTAIHEFAVVFSGKHAWAKLCALAPPSDR